MPPMARMPIPIVDMQIVSMRWRGHRMARGSPRGAMMIRCRYGMQPMAGMFSPIAGMLMLCGGWHGHRMARGSFLGAGISIMEEAIQPRRGGMGAMAGASSLYVVLTGPHVRAQCS